MFNTVIIVRPKEYESAYRASPDGIHWSEPITRSPGRWDRSTVFFNPFRNVWVFGLRTWYGDLGRARASVLWDPARPLATISGKLGGDRVTVVTQTR